MKISLFAVALLSAIAGISSQGKAQSYDSSAFAPLHWRSVGPFRAGRSVAVAGSVARPKEYYAGTTGGGVFKTISGGNAWFPVSDGYFGGTIGGIAISPSNPDVVYVGTGEYAVRNNISPGDGVYKTTDGGKTWSFVGLKESRHISRVIVHPTNPDLVYVAAQGHAFGANPERGVYRSTDGGKQWQRVLFLNDSVGTVDLTMDATNPRILYAALAYLRKSNRGEFTGKVSGGIFKTTDGGDRWTELTRNPGLPQGRIGNVGLSVSPANPNIVWAIVEAKDGGLFRSRDAGATWQLITNDGDVVHGRHQYYSRVTADTQDSNTVYVPNTDLYRSTDGGKTFGTIVAAIRRQPDKPGAIDYVTDSHQLWIAPDNARRMIVAHDQGMRVSEDAGATWSPVSQATGQVYGLAVTNHFPYQLCGSYQDNDAYCGPSRSDVLFDISAWYNPGGGEGSLHVARPDRPNITYATGMVRHDRTTGVFQDRDPWVPADIEWSDRTFLYRWFYPGPPLHISPHDPSVLYLGKQMVFRTRTEGQTWEIISPDLTNAPPSATPEKMAADLQRAFQIGAAAGVTNGDGAYNVSALVTIAESPVTAGIIWTGSSDGVVSLTRNGGKTWENVTPRDLPPLGLMNRIEPSHYAAGTAYLAATRYLLDDYTPYLFKTTDYGRSWTRIDRGIPRDEFTRIVREDPVRRGLLFVGTERGVWVSFDDGERWQSLQRNLPSAPIYELLIKDGDIAVAAHGRSFWILDDISPLRELTPAVVATPAHLFQPLDAYRVRWDEENPALSKYAWGLSLIHANPVGENPLSGVVINYWLKVGGELVALEMLDSTGTLIRSFSSRPTATSGESEDMVVPNAAGLNRFAWDYLYPSGASTVDSIFESIGAPGFAAPPGRYSVRLRVGTESQTRSFRLKKDPRIPASTADLHFNVRVSKEVTRGIAAVNALHALRQQLADRTERLPANHVARSRIAALQDSLLTIERRFISPTRSQSNPWLPYRQSALAMLSGSFIKENVPPSARDQLVFTKGSTVLRRELAQLTRVVSGALPSINAALRTAALDEIALPTALRAQLR
jgi:photosystem II stability/assembly factor-like uncharacterized protein